MTSYKKPGWNKLPFILLLALIGIVSCHFKKNMQERPTGMIAVTDTINPPTPLSLDFSRLDSIRIIYTADETIERNFPLNNWEELQAMLRTARYDKEWNDSGIMIAMIAQDYSLILSYKDQPQEENEWLLIWQTNERIKYRNKWYFVDTQLKDMLCKKLESWK